MVSVCGLAHSLTLPPSPFIPPPPQCDTTARLHRRDKKRRRIKRTDVEEIREELQQLVSHTQSLSFLTHSVTYLLLSLLWLLLWLFLWLLLLLLLVVVVVCLPRAACLPSFCRNCPKLCLCVCVLLLFCPAHLSSLTHSKHSDRRLHLPFSPTNQPTNPTQPSPPPPPPRTLGGRRPLRRGGGGARTAHGGAADGGAAAGGGHGGGGRVRLGRLVAGQGL
jgi:uncharacterized membrane protein YgcG